MIVGTTKLDYKSLKRFVGRPEELLVYTDNLVPKWARHIESIVLNQRYYVAIHLRNVLSIPYKQRMQLVEHLLSSVTLQGVTSEFVAITEIVDSCDKEALIKMLEVKLNGF